ncbi:CSN6 [Scenedesmus sp. PABB004]|nr:CSN6 [Scenedesmus sp. PABB004]
MALRVDESRQSGSGLEFKLHPLVLINVSDHHTRLRANGPDGAPAPRVMGCLLGSQDGRSVDVANSFEIKYAETEDGWEVDTAFLTKKQEQYKQVFPKQDVVGWYCTGAAVEARHLRVHAKVCEVNESPLFLLLNPVIDPARKDLPVAVYETELHTVDGVPQTTFVRAHYSMETSDAERIGVDQVAKILPSGKASGSEQLTAHLAGLHSAVKMLAGKLAAIQAHLEDVAAGRAPFDHGLMRQVHSLVCGLPALDSAAFRKEYLTEFNDTLATLLLAGLTQSLAGLGELTDRFGVAYDRGGRRGRGGGGGMMAASARSSNERAPIFHDSFLPSNCRTEAAAHERHGRPRAPGRGHCARPDACRTPVRGWSWRWSLKMAEQAAQRPRGSTARWAAAAALLPLLLLARPPRGALGAEEDPEACPGVESGVCTAPCQLAVCEALAAFHRATFNASAPWAHTAGWEASRGTPCEAIVSRDPGDASGGHYCSWPGVSCCASPACGALHAVRGLDLQVNGLNGSVDNADFVDALLRLHACGLTKLQAQGNELSGRLEHPGWGRLSNLVYLDLSNNWISGTLPATLRSLRRLTRLSLGTNPLHGTLPAWLGDELHALEVLSLGACTGPNPGGRGLGLAGPLPSSLARLANLTVLNLELNALSGALPAELCGGGGGASRLRVLKARGNRLTGKPFATLRRCGSLTQLDLAGNNFTGGLDIEGGGGGSGGGGGAGAAVHWAAAGGGAGVWPQLAVLDASNNALTGPLPPGLFVEAPVLEFLNLAANKLSGPIPRHVSLSSYLREINLERNALSGPLDDGLWLLPHLRLLDLSGNHINGSISAAIGVALPPPGGRRASNLEDLQLAGNALSGPLPPEAGLLRKLDLINLSHNPRLACPPPVPGWAPMLGGGPGGSGAALVPPPPPRCDPGALLPCFLELSDVSLPRTDSSHMACPLVLRRPLAEAAAACGGGGGGALGKSAHSLADATAEDQAWKIDPSYYQFHGCTCLTGFDELWLQDGTLLVCLPQPPPPARPPWLAGVIEAAAVAGSLLLASAALLAWLRTAVALRPRWRREQELAAHRAAGMPAGGPASLVVTDIESYSELMASNAPLATKALGIHNAVLRRAAAAHAGHVVEQEGDSWTVAFHTPLEAAAFCLQSQQALVRVNWHDLGARPLFSTPSKQRASTDAAPGSPGAGGRAQNGGGGGAAASALLRQRSSDAGGAAAGGRGVGRPGWVRVADGEAAAGLLGAAHESPFAAPLGASGDRKAAASSEQLPDCRAVVLSLGSATAAGDAAGGDHDAGLAALREVAGSGGPSPAGSGEGGAAAGGPWALASALSGGAGGRVRRNSGGGSRSSRFWAMLGVSGGAPGAKGGPEGPAPPLMGLRVRMGVASGHVPRGTPISRCAVLELAKGISELAHGGQVLLDAATCAGVRDRLAELGGVDHRGYNDATLAHAVRAAMRQHSAGLLCRHLGRLRLCMGASPGGDGPGLDSDAVLLDMGTFFLPRLAGAIAAAAASGAGCDGGLARHSSSRGGAPSPPGSPGGPEPLAPLLVAAGGGRAALAAAAAAATPPLPSACAPGGGRLGGAALQGGLVLPTLQLVSILPRALAGRARQWGAALALAPGDQQIAAGYFDAPGTDAAPLLPAVSPRGSAAGALATPQGSRTLGAGGGGRWGGGGWGLGPLPPCTLVFARVEGLGRGRGHHRTDAARVVHATLAHLMQALLLALGGGPAGRRWQGYLCRAQEAELQYMLAFSDPPRALEWALLLQEVLQHLPWPPHVLEACECSGAGGAHACPPPAPPAPPQHPARRADSARPRSSSDSSGAPGGWGRPCIKIGLADGPPSAIGPDHLGRADYHGPYVNLAARMMAAAAAGGQVVTSSETAQTIFSAWRYEAELAKLHQQPRQPAADSEAASCARLPAQLPESAAPQGPTPTPAPARRQSQGDAAPPYPARTLCVSGWHIGTLGLKGCGALESVSFTATAPGHPPVPPPPAAPPRGSKGALLHARAGPVVGMQGCPVRLPDVLPALGATWAAAACAAEAEAARRRTQLAGGPGSMRGESSFGVFMRGESSFGVFTLPPDTARSRAGTFAAAAQWSDAPAAAAGVPAAAPHHRGGGHLPALGESITAQSSSSGSGSAGERGV